MIDLGTPGPLGPIWLHPDVYMNYVMLLYPNSVEAQFFRAAVALMCIDKQIVN